MGVKDRLTNNEKSVSKTMNLDDKLYSRIEKIAKKKYNKSVSAVINACIYELADTENIKIYENENELLVKHTIVIRKSALNELERLRNKYKISLYRLVNIAMNNAIEDLEN